jgi:Holliday junction resolvase
MSNLAKNKGGAGEREIATLLNDRLGLDIKRNLEQCRSGGYDLVGLDGIALEVKRCKALSMKSWWDQAVAQAETLGLVPVLVYRLDRKQWQFVLPYSALLDDVNHLDTDINHTVAMGLDLFCYAYSRGGINGGC